MLLLCHLFDGANLWKRFDSAKSVGDYFFVYMFTLVFSWSGNAIKASSI